MAAAVQRPLVASSHNPLPAYQQVQETKHEREHFIYF
jgi:hypothetical protein